MALGKRPREAEEPRGDEGRVDIHQIPPKKRARGGASNGVPKAARTASRTRHKPGARTPKARNDYKSKESGRGAERLATPSAQGLYNQTLLGHLQQGWAEEGPDGSMIWIVGRVDEKGVCHRYSTMEQQKQQETNKLEAMHKALREDPQTASGVEEYKCRLCPGTNLKTHQDFKRHCNTAEAHPLEISFCDDCGDFFARKDSLLRHQKNPPPECKSLTKEEAERKRKVGEKKRKETELLHDDFLRGLEEYLKTKTGEGFAPFSQIIKAKYPESAKKNKFSKKNISSSS